MESLNSIGVPGPRFQVVHEVWLNDDKIQMMAKSRAHHVYCSAQIPKLVKTGVDVALATDRPASNNNHDMFEVMKSAALRQKISTLNPKALSCEQTLEMATVNGARAVGLVDEIRSIQPGKRADLIIVNLRRSHSAPVHKPVSSMVYCAHSDAVETVMVDGKILMEDGKLTELDEEKILSEAEKAAHDLAS